MNAGWLGFSASIATGLGGLLVGRYALVLYVFFNNQYCCHSKTFIQVTQCISMYIFANCPLWARSIVE